MAGMLSSLGAGMAGGAVVNVLINGVDNVSPILSKINKNLLVAGGIMVGIGVAGVAMASNLVSAASDVQESVNAVTVTYGKNAEAVLKIGENAATSFGMSRNEYNASAVRFSAFAEVIAKDGGTVAGIVGDLTTRTADFASVMNVDLGTAQTLVSAGLAGETEGLRRYGIDVSAATVKAYAMSQGIGDGSRELTEQEKILARYGLIMSQTEKFAGDFANTSDSLANRQRILQASFTDLKAELGEVLLPVFEAVVGVVQKAVSWFAALPKPLKQGIIIFAALASTLLILAGVIMIVTAVSGALAIVWSPITLIVLGIIAVIAALIFTTKLLIDNWDKVKVATQNVGIAIKNVWIGVKNAVVWVWNFIVQHIEDSINAILMLFKPLIEAFNYITGAKIKTSVDFSAAKGSMSEYGAFNEMPTATEDSEELKEVNTTGFETLNENQLMSIDSSQNIEKLDVASVKSTNFISQKAVPAMMKNDKLENEKSMLSNTKSLANVKDTNNANTKNLITVMDKNTDLISASVIGIGTDIHSIIITGTNALGRAIASLNEDAKFRSISGGVSTSLGGMISKYRVNKIRDEISDINGISTKKGRTEPTFYIENINGITARDLADSLQEELNKKFAAGGW